MGALSLYVLTLGIEVLLTVAEKKLSLKFIDNGNANIHLIWYSLTLTAHSFLGTIIKFSPRSKRKHSVQ